LRLDLLAIGSDSVAHIAVSGTGRVGGQVAFSLLLERYVTELSLVDTAPKVAEMTREELCHAMADHGFDVNICSYENNKSVQGADLIVVAAGFPRAPEMSRRELAAKNAEIVRGIVEDTLDNNPDAMYFIITNPVDAMTTLANGIVKGERTVIGTGTNLDTSRFRTVLSRKLNVPISAVEAYVGGEHGEAAVPLWSTVKVDGSEFDKYIKKKRKTIDKMKCEHYVKEVSREIIRTLGGTRYGPAGCFVEIVRGLMLNTGKIISYSRLSRLFNTPEPVHITIPARIARSLGPDLWDSLNESERRAIEDAARTIYATYREACGMGS
jgi:malate dehydrogenase